MYLYRHLLHPVTARQCGSLASLARTYFGGYTKAMGRHRNTEVLDISGTQPVHTYNYIRESINNRIANEPAIMRERETK